MLQKLVREIIILRIQMHIELDTWTKLRSKSIVREQKVV